tara:strand:+ start:1174 stop:1608 length:435 start_codon:yes stop_codon:yes gene_type:complete
MKIIKKLLFIYFITTSINVYSNEVDNFIVSYFDSFNKADISAFHDKFHNPFIRILNGKTELVESNFWFNFEELKTTQWVYSSILNTNKIFESEHEAIVKITYARHNKEGKIFNKGIGFMILSKIDDKWGISTYVNSSLPEEGIK